MMVRRATSVKCINCEKKRSCVLVVASLNGAEIEHIPICQPCLREDNGTLGAYLAGSISVRGLGSA
jgi:hypothetical protein